MKILNTWRDDKLPCIEFEHNGQVYQVLWTSPKLEGKLELVQDGDVSLEVALRLYPELLKALNGDVEGLDRLDREEDSEDEEFDNVYNIDAGILQWKSPST